ncbi:NAD-dependent epimerase/dehydratase family protein [Streptococcus oricebi]|uniref:NAD-dependent epimerase n=1 Tax=Streptococcus oricebi TaxID=1547447 RepID=A0ABS5B543_9STRE|nr:NAD-dependent epimerase [Streptococcus oricebi]
MTRKWKVLITGENSYIGRSFKTYLENDPAFEMEELDVRGTAWQDFDFSQADTVFHVAGIAHVDSRKADQDLYYQVNTQLTEKVAKKAKEAGVQQFIFMSSAIVYGDSMHQLKQGRITKNTQPQPSNHYGKSKLLAEEKLNALAASDFKVVNLRPPMIYGPASKGNYPRLAKLAQEIPVFPKVNNQRSMLFIDNLCEFIRLMIVNQESGTFHPQNKDYVNTSQLVEAIAKAHQKKIWLVGGFAGLLAYLSKHQFTLNKLFGDLVYDQDLSSYSTDYSLVGFETSIERTEQE